MKKPTGVSFYLLRKINNCATVTFYVFALVESYRETSLLMHIPTRKNPLNWNLLKAFVEIAHYQSFTQAGRAAGVQRPTISQKISALEASLGVQLMERATGGDGFRLTQRG